MSWLERHTFSPNFAELDRESESLAIWIPKNAHRFMNANNGIQLSFGTSAASLSESSCLLSRTDFTCTLLEFCGYLATGNFAEHAPLLVTRRQQPSRTGGHGQVLLQIYQI